MKLEQYGYLAPYYDKLNADIDYSAWASFIESVLSRNGIASGDLVLDLACGTGNITLELARRGYDMIGVDYSAEMLWAAREKLMLPENADMSDKLLLIQQDMRSFELYGTVKAVVCCLDSINYLLSDEDLDQCFSLVRNYIEPDGIFIFDVNTRYKFENVYGDNAYILEADGVYCGWQNSYDPDSRLCDFDLDIFAEDEDGGYTRFSETQTERCHSDETLRHYLEKNDFEVIYVASDLDMTPVSPSDERHHYICRCKKTV